MVADVVFVGKRDRRPGQDRYHERQELLVDLVHDRRPRRGSRRVAADRHGVNHGIDGAAATVDDAAQSVAAAGGGLVTWALIAGYGTDRQVGVTAFVTTADPTDFELEAAGLAVGIHDRVEPSYARQWFGLGITVPGESISRDVIGAKLRGTKANQYGLPGFGGDLNARYRILPEASVGLFLTDRLLLGGEGRRKPNNLSAFREQTGGYVFVAWFPNKRVSLTAAWVMLGQIADKQEQEALYFSFQINC